MVNPRNSTRRLAYRILALALALSVQSFAEQTANFTHTVGGTGKSVERNVRVVNSTGFNIYLNAPNGQGGVLNAGSGRTISASFSYDFPGNPPSGGSIEQEGTIPAVALSWYRAGDPTTDVGGQSVAGFPVTGILTHGGPPYVNYVTLAQATLTIGPGGTVQSLTDPVGDENNEPEPPLDPDAGKVFEEGVLMLDNRTGVPQQLQLGDEVIELQPGMNAIPFYGQTLDGFPKALPTDFEGTKVLGPDGQKVWHGVLGNGIEYAPEWKPAASGAYQLFGPPSSNSGPVLSAPGANGNQVYSGLPPGMTKGSALPLPGGMSQGTLGLPPGVTPGTNGALPRGVASGGSLFLPQGVSPGVNPITPPSGMTPGTSGIRPPGTRVGDPGVPSGSTSGGSSGGGSGGSGGSTAPPVVGTPSSGSGSGMIGGGGVQSSDETPDENSPYQAGSSMAGLGDEGKALGESSALEVGQGVASGLNGISESVGEGFGEGGFAFWTAPGPNIFDGQDNSWLSMTLALGTKTVNIEVPQEWVSLIRSILVWVLRIGFVYSCIKLVMK